MTNFKLNKFKKFIKWLRKPKKEKGVIRDWIETIIFAGAMALIIKSTLVQAFYIPSSSMEATLLIDDHILVNRLSFKFFNVDRHDIIVFKFPHDSDNPQPETQYKSLLWSPIYYNKKFDSITNFFKYYRPRDFIKRCVGLPGDIIEIERKKVFINGKSEKLEEAIHSDDNIMIKRDYFGPIKVPKKNHILNINKMNLYELFCLKKYFEYKHIDFKYNIDFFVNGNQIEYIDTVQGKISVNEISLRDLCVFYTKYKLNNLNVSFNINNVYVDNKKTVKYKMLENCYFALGDNRDNSSDSRFWGYVPENFLVGSPFLIYWPVTRIRIVFD